MNAQQSKALVDAARKAREALLALDPDSIVALGVAPSGQMTLGVTNSSPDMFGSVGCS